MYRLYNPARRPLRSCPEWLAVFRLGRPRFSCRQSRLDAAKYDHVNTPNHSSAQLRWDVPNNRRFLGIYPTTRVAGGGCVGCLFRYQALRYCQGCFGRCLGVQEWSVSGTGVYSSTGLSRRSVAYIRTKGPLLLAKRLRTELSATKRGLG